MNFKSVLKKVGTTVVMTSMLMAAIAPSYAAEGNVVWKSGKKHTFKKDCLNS